MKSSPMLTELERIARSAGLAIQQTPKSANPAVEKGGGDFATLADLKAEELITAELTKCFSGIPIVSEESFVGDQVPQEAFVVDPLDGTLIYSRGCREWGVILCYLRSGRPHSGVIFQPDTDTLLTAERDHGCFLNGRQIRFDHSLPQEKLSIALDLGYAVDQKLMSHLVQALLPQMLLCRTFFSAVGNIFDFVQQHTDVMFNCGGKIWDFAVGSLACEEAGGISCRLDGGALTWDKLPAAGVLFTNQAVAERVLKLIGV